MEKPDYKEVEIEEYEGPYINEYLRGMTPGPNGNKFKTMDEAVNAANRNKYCRGVTLTRQGIFTLRSGKVLKPSDKNNRFKNIEITWVKKNLVDDKIRKNQLQNVKKDITYEKIKYGGKDYYYNIKNRRGILIETNERFIMKMGKFVEEN
jgi:hypothetical protein